MNLNSVLLLMAS